MKSQTRLLKLFETILLVLLGVLMYVSQVIMAPLPNIEAVSLLIIVITCVFGVKALCSVYIFTFCEIFTYGIEIWVINYLYVWAILCLIVLPLKKIDNNIFFAVVAAVYGMAFGTLCSIPYFITGGFAGGISYIFYGLRFDVYHCVGNFFMVLLLYKPLKTVLQKAVNKYFK